MLQVSRAYGQGGFTLIELVIVTVIVAMLAAFAISSYSDYVRKARRADAQQRIQQIVLAQERFRAENPGYTSAWASLGGDPDSVDPEATGRYYDWPDVVVDNTVTPRTFTITASAVGSQAKDKVGSQSCATLTMNQAGNGTPAACWAK
jgi:type IV pilus assembly protein PilE